MEFVHIKTILQNYKIGIAGAGGLGSNCAVALVRSGINNLTVADYDRIDESNLNRQFYFKDQIGQLKVNALKNNLLRINPELVMKIIPEMLTVNNIAKHFEDVDILIEAFDSADQKEMMLETALTLWPERPLITGLGMAGYGMSNSLKVSSSNNLYICGDGTEEIAADNPPLAPRVGIVANMQANTVLEIILSKFHGAHENNHLRN
ncbi:MAG: sulfur carrier protein ThiS adenylyltransferase ThiF [Bacteroidales bacterium]|nr:sulfur carrier protein ThiS adenylyltransferase ThiF [Bacteroidales bacterium]